jgi:hypothetical protein
MVQSSLWPWKVYISVWTEQYISLSYYRSPGQFLKTQMTIQKFTWSMLMSHMMTFFWRYAFFYFNAFFLWTYSPSSVDDAYLMNLSHWCCIYYSYVHSKEPVYLGFQEKKGTKIIIVGQDFHITKVTNLTTISEDHWDSIMLLELHMYYRFLTEKLLYIFVRCLKLWTFQHSSRLLC